ncbi:hypothetical protein DENSPDRAFT_629862 [Dentipellis sp. KUC8613]|nr:hypothetical protein DENSPDRAFT_629862 [Dentipellis sp. KUC8613]
MRSTARAARTGRPNTNTTTRNQQPRRHRRACENIKHTARSGSPVRVTSDTCALAEPPALDRDERHHDTERLRRLRLRLACRHHCSFRRVLIYAPIDRDPLTAPHRCAFDPDTRSRPPEAALDRQTDPSSRSTACARHAMAFRHRDSLSEQKMSASGDVRRRKILNEITMR